MDFDASISEHARLVEFADLTREAVEPGVAPKLFDRELDRAIAESPLGTHNDRLGRTLVAVESARRGLPIALGLRALVAPELSHNPSEFGCVAIMEAGSDAPVRFGQVADTIVAIGSDDVAIVPAAIAAIAPLQTSSGYPFARVATEDRSQVIAGKAETVRARWELALCAELAGNLSGALQCVTSYLQERRQFGRALASMQALRHRVSEAAVDIESLSSLTLLAAYTGQPDAVRNAAVLGEEVAARLVPDFTQLAGARAFAVEFGLSVWTMRATALRLELATLLAWASASEQAGV